MYAIRYRLFSSDFLSCGSEKSSDLVFQDHQGTKPGAFEGKRGMLIFWCHGRS